MTLKSLTLAGITTLAVGLFYVSEHPQPIAIAQIRLPAARSATQPPFKLDGKPVYVRRNGGWHEARLRGYRTQGSTTTYTVQYIADNLIENNVTSDRILSLEAAQRRNLATTVYDVSTPAGVKQMLDAHNAWRNRAGVPPLTWSPQLASYAQEWATKLLRENRFEHRSNLAYGENLAWAGGQQLSPERVVKMWGDEIADYNYANNSCRTGKMCGHYTQIVWRKTQQVGCGMARGNGKEIWVCNYNPPGNVVGQRPY